MRLRAALIAVALALAFASTASAQNLRSLVRATSTTGGNDSTLTLASDSAFRTRAMSLAQFRKALSVKAFDSLLTTTLNLTGGTVTGAPTWSTTQSLNTSGSAATLTNTRTLWGQNFNGSANVTGSLTSVGNITGGASSMTIQAGTGASRTLTLSGTDAGSSVTTFLTCSSTLCNTGVAEFDVNNASDARLIRNGNNDFQLDAGVGHGTLHLTDALTLTGGAGSMTILSGSGAARTLTLQTTTSGSAAQSVQFLGADASTTFFGQGLGVSGTAAAPSWAFNNSLTTGLYRVGADTLGIAIAGANAFQVPALGKLVGGAGNMTLTAGTGNSRTMTLQTTTSAGTAKNTLVLGADTSATFLGAGTFGGALTATLVTAAQPNITSLGTLTGFVTTFASTTPVITNSGNNAAQMRFSGFAGIAGHTEDANEGSIIIGSSSTGRQTIIRNDYQSASVLDSYFDNSADVTGGRILFRHRTSGTPLNTLILTDVSAIFGTTITPATDNANDLGSASKRWSELYINPATSGAGDTYVCLSTGQQLHQGVTCAASTLKMKDSVVSYTGADAILRLRPVTFNFKAGYYGQRAEIGLIAEEAALVDPRFVFVASKFDTLQFAPVTQLNMLTQKLDTLSATPPALIKPGEPEALNVSSIVAALVAQVQVQKRQLDSLSAVVFALQAKLP